jgi:septal ring factor EnvC (AmiA/AmiB activator)
MNDKASGAGAAADASIDTTPRLSDPKAERAVLRDNVKNAQDKVRTMKAHLADAEKGLKTAEAELAAAEKE